jgi:hypothetical protein
LVIKAPSLATEQQLRAFVSNSRDKAYVEEVIRLYPVSGYSPEIVIAQWDVETGHGSEPEWTARLNPAGIGVTDARDFGYSWTTPAAAAQAQIVHLSAYVDGYNYGLRKYLGQDPRYLLVLGTDWAGTVSTVDDLAGKWATDPDYGQKIADRVSRIRGGVTPQPGGKLSFGNVPRPHIVDRVIPDSRNWAWDRLGQRMVKGVVYHRQLGTNWGTDAWFRGGGGGIGLTDYGIDSKSGEILKWNDPWGKGGPGVSTNRSPYASGGPGGTSGDGTAFVKKLGRIAINRDLASIEIDRWYESPISEDGYSAIILLSAHLADSAMVPWTDYPYNPHTGLNFVYWHNEFQGEKPCPGKVVMDATAQIIEDTKQIMKKYQE